MHLHGRARELEDEPENLVFGMAEYLDASLAAHAWHKVFGDLFLTEPFVVVGARLADELDLATVLSRGNQSSELHGVPSFVVLQSIGDFQREELSAWGLIPVEATGEEFFAAVTEGLPAYKEHLGAKLRAGRELPSEATRFLSQFRQLTLDEEPELDRRHDLYAGHDPTWQDVVRSRDAVFEVSERLTTAAQSCVDLQDERRLLCVHGPRFTGKTAALLRTGRELIARGNDVYLFVGDERPTIDAVQWWLERAGPTVLLFDGMADFVPDFEDLLERLDLDSTRLVVLGTERATRLPRLRARLAAERIGIDAEFELRRLTDPDINALLGKLRDAGRLGRISRRPRGGQLSYFRTEHARTLFSAMAELERAEGFRHRLRERYAALDDRGLQRAYGACCLVHSLGYATPLAVAANVSGVSGRALLVASRDDDAFGELVTVDRDKLRTRQRTLASVMTETVLQPSERFDLSFDLATALGSYISPQTIRQRTLPARIAAEMMDHRILQDWVGAENIDRWYEGQLEFHGWNARFWEQRALFVSERGDWDRAESYAEKAVDLHTDPFTLNTLGVILARKATEWAEPVSSVANDYYWRAVRALAESRDRGKGLYAHPFMTFFTYTLGFVRRELEAQGGIVESSIARTWNDWMLRARNAKAASEPELAERLDEFQRDWLYLAARAN